jgi:hypothetical protein
MDQRTNASLGVRAQQGHGAATVTATPTWARALWSARVPKQVELAHFDQVLLNFLQLNCHKQSIPK